MRKLFAVIIALASLTLAAPAHATPGIEPTLGSWTTVQTLTTSAGTHHFEYDYTITVRDSTRSWFELTEARYSGPGSGGCSYQGWNPLVALSPGATTVASQTGSFISATGKGFGALLATSLPNGTLTIHKGVGSAGAGWNKQSLTIGGTPTYGNLFKTWIGGSGTNNCASSTNFDLATNTLPTPPTPKNIAGTFSMDFNCTSPANTAYASHWTWYYTVTGTNPSWTLTTTGLVRNSETGTPTTDLGFASNPHVVNGDVIAFTWASGAAPAVNFVAQWSGTIYCDSNQSLTANF